MAGVSWPTVAVSTAFSATVSALVALATDLVARPGLEARKERILERHRARREFAGALRKIQLGGAMMASATSDGMPPDLAARLAAEMDRQRQELLQVTRQMQDQLPVFALHIPAGVTGPLARAMGLLRGILISDRANEAVGDEVAAVSGPWVDYFHTPPRRVRSLD